MQVLFFNLLSSRTSPCFPGLLIMSLPISSDDSRWYYAKGKQRMGPVSLAQLHQLRATGEIQPTTMLLQEGTRHWVAAGSLLEKAAQSTLAGTLPPLAVVVVPPKGVVPPNAIPLSPLPPATQMPRSASAKKRFVLVAVVGAVLVVLLGIAVVIQKSFSAKPENKSKEVVRFKGKATDFWVRQLQDKDIATRIEAINALGEIGRMALSAISYFHIAT